MSELDRERRHWEDLAGTDPMWVILTEPGREGRWSAEEFFQSGRDEIAALFRDLAAAGLEPKRATALDFGCGLGRLTQALCERFEVVHGVDISQTMIDGARSHNRFGDRARYYANTLDQLPMLASDSIDLVYSRLVIQHIPSATAEKYVAEFARVLAPGGICVIQLPTRARRLSVRIRHRLRSAFPDAYRAVRDFVSRKARWEINTIPEARVEAILRAGGARLHQVVDDGAAGAAFDSRTFYAVKR